MSSINEWTYSDKEKGWNDLFTRVRGSSLRAFPIGVFPWKKISKVEVMTFNSRLEPSNFGHNWSGFNPIKETKYLACDVGETSLDLETLPLNYIYDNFLKLDIDNTDNVIEFIKNYGMPYCPYFDCKQGFYRTSSSYHTDDLGTGSSYHIRDLYRQKKPGRKKTAKSKIDLDKLALFVIEGMCDVEAWEERFSYLVAGNGFCGCFRDAAMASEGIRREAATRESLKDRHVISLEEVKLTLKFMQEIVGLMIGLDINNGNLLGAQYSMMKLGIFPDALFGEISCDYSVDDIPDILNDRLPVEGKGKNQAEVIRHLASLMKLCSSVSNSFIFLNSLVFDNGGTYYNNLPVFLEGTPAAEMYSTMAPNTPGGIMEAIATALMAELALKLDWQACAACGKLFKRYAGNGKTEAEFQRAKKSDYCSPQCQQKGKREYRKKAKEYAAGIIKRDKFVFDAGGLEDYLLDIQKLANEQWTPLRDPSKFPIIKLSELEKTYHRIMG